ERAILIQGLWTAKSKLLSPKDDHGGDPHKSGRTLYWKFREIPDESFRKLHPHITERQGERLEEATSAFAERVCVAKRKIGKGSLASQNVKLELVKSANSDQVTSLGGLSCGSMTMSDATRNTLLVAIKKILQTDKVCR
ncbi:hypothetical protein PIB30_105699, partial [Stylosanthes scabra]|nr:hypothetical protein [Stylosanthes scabra]